MNNTIFILDYWIWGDIAYCLYIKENFLYLAESKIQREIKND